MPSSQPFFLLSRSGGAAGAHERPGSLLNRLLLPRCHRLRHRDRSHRLQQVAGAEPETFLLTWEPAWDGPPIPGWPEPDGPGPAAGPPVSPEPQWGRPPLVIRLQDPPDVSGDPQHSRAGAGCCGDGAAVPRGLAGSRSPALGAVWGWAVGFWQRPAASLLSGRHRGHRLGCEILAESNAASGTQPSALVPCQAPTAAAPLQRFPFQEGFAELLIPPQAAF